MFKVIGCITTAHDLRLVALAALVCLLAVGATFYLYAILPKAPARARAAWLAGTGLVAGSGIWAVHFIAMLAFEPGMPSGYAPLTTLASLVIAVVFSGFGLAAAAPATDGSRRVIAGGALLGMGITLMHFTGMAALRVPGLIRWDMAYVAASVVIAVLFASLALAVGKPGARLRNQIFAAGLLLLGICGLHFTAMAAMTIVPGLSRAIPPQLFSRATLAIGVTGLTILIIAIAGGGLFIDLRLRRRAFGQLREAIEAMPDGMVVCDADDRLVAWNECFAEQMGGGAITLSMGMASVDLLAAIAERNVPGDAQTRAAWVQERLAVRRASAPDLEMEMYDGRWLRVHHRLTRNGGLVTVCVDITELKRDAKVLSEALATADAANRAKTEFLANITHEIRTPLNGVLGMAQVMAMSQLSPIQSERLAVIERSGADLLAILNDVLDLTSIEAGKLKLEEGEIDADNLGAKVHADFAAAVRARSEVNFRVSVANDATGPRRADLARVRQVLNTLVDNALKFTSAGEVCVSITDLADEGVDGLRLRVSDTGVGIPADALPTLFEKFTQVDSSNTRRYGGAGLGLTIARALTELMGGRISVDSTPGQGSTFTLALPAPRIEPAARRSNAA